MGRQPLIGYRRTSMNLPVKQMEEAKERLPDSGCRTIAAFYELAAERLLEALRKKK